MAEELTELLMNELTMGEYQSTEAAKVQLTILFRILPHDISLIKIKTITIPGGKKKHKNDSSR